MRRILWILFGLVAITSLGYWYLGQQPSEIVTQEGAGIRLTNRPASFCPTAAQVVIIKTATPQSIELDKLVSVMNCSEIILEPTNLANAAEYQLFVLVPGARAFRIVAAGPITSLIDAPIQIGDTNQDNVINEVDQRFVEGRIGQTSLEALAADIDGDAAVTILDHSLVATNQGAGVERPDQKPWRDQ